MVLMPGAAAGAVLGVPSGGGGASTAPLDRWGLRDSPPSTTASLQGLTGKLAQAGHSEQAQPQEH